MIVSNLTMDQHGTREATSMETHGGLKAMHRDIRLVQQRHGSQEKTRIEIEERPQLDPHVHISLGWMDARAWYQLTTLLSRSYYMTSSHISRMKHAKEDGI
jgi:hypothetical protein